MAKILLIGGTGFIGSHVGLELISAGHDIVLFDNLSNSDEQTVERMSKLSASAITFVQGDMLDETSLNQVFQTYQPELVVLLAGLKSVAESVRNPDRYHRVNVGGAQNVLDAMQRHKCVHIVFSSSATVYGEPENNALSEDHPLRPYNPYGQCKLNIEQKISSFSAAQLDRSAINLRYFNPVGAHPSGELGEDPNGVPENLFPFIAKVVSGALEKLNIFGVDYDTNDGSGERDYIHIDDLAKGHVAAIEALLSGKLQGTQNINLGTGKPHSVLEVLAQWQTTIGRDIPHTIASRRAGDLPCYYADPSLAEELLDWKATKSLSDMVEDHWRWLRKNLAIK